MSKTLQIRNVPEEILTPLHRWAADAGMCVSVYVLRGVKMDLERSTVAEMFERAAARRSRVSLDDAACVVSASRDERW